MPAPLKVDLSPIEDQALLALTQAKGIPPRTQSRATVLRLSAAGWTVLKIAQYLKWHPQTVRDTIHRWYWGKLDSLWDCSRPGRRRRWHNPNMKSLLQFKISLFSYQLIFILFSYISYIYLMLFLHSHGVSTTYAVKIYRQYKDEALATLTSNPYQLAADIYGIGFLRTDKIAFNLGVAPDSQFRYRAGLIHVLNEAAADGHCYLPQPKLIENVIKLLTTPDRTPEEDALADIIKDMALKDDLIREKSEDQTLLCYLPTYFHTEQNLAQLIQSRFCQPVAQDMPRVRAWIERFTKSRKIKLSPQQRLAVEMAAYSRVMILTGGPGCGKTFTTQTIVSLWKAMGKSIALAAPTGRAAQRLSEITQLEAKTIHCLLEFDPKTMGFKHDNQNPLPHTAIVALEASMLDLFLASSLVKAIQYGSQLLLVGDIDQFPSVGPGQILADLINSGHVPVVRLTKVFRQAQQSAIITAAHQINRSQFPTIEPISDNPVSECLWHGGGHHPKHGVKAISEIITDLIPRLGYNRATDVQVLCPTSRGLLGTRNLNTVLQQLINPPSPDKVEITRGGNLLREGDRIIQLTNDYHHEIFNGDFGIIKVIDPEEMEVIVQYRKHTVVRTRADLNQIALAWSLTIHQSQGSEYPVVILPIYTQPYMMLSREQLYTALTSAKQLAIVVGSKKAISKALRSSDDQLRYTRLQQAAVGKRFFAPDDCNLEMFNLTISPGLQLLLSIKSEKRSRVLTLRVLRW